LAFHDLNPFPKDLSQIRANATKHTMGYKQLLWRIGCPPVSLRTAVSRLQEDGFLISSRTAGSTMLRLTAAGRELLFRRLPAVLSQRQRWDRSWRIILFSGVRNGRNLDRRYRTLRSVLQEHHFVQLERGVYASPYPLQEYTKESLLSAKALGLCLAFETKTFILGDDAEMIRHGFQLEMQEKQYSSISERMSNLLTKIAKEKDGIIKQKEQFSDVGIQFFSVLMNDPGYPPEVNQVYESMRKALVAWYNLDAKFIVA
jgi:DNA-binding transcriptional regulator PaaX